MAKKILLYSFFFLMIARGCVVHIEEKGFAAEKINLDWGFVSAKLIGKHEEDFFSLFIGSPYDLAVWFGANNLLEGVLTIQGIKLISSDTNKIVFIQNKSLKKRIKATNYMGNIRYRVHFSFDDLKLEYENLILEIDFSLKQGKGIAHHKVRINLIKTHNDYYMIRSV